MFVSAFRTLILYILLITGLRFMGKRQIGQMQASELVTAILLSELITAPILDQDLPILAAAIPFLLLLAFEIIVPWFAARYPFVKRVVDGRPAMVIYNGKIDQAQLLAMRMSVDELLGHLRLKDVGDISDVQYAIFEQNGQLSVFLRAGACPATVDDLSLAPMRKGIAHPLVVQGQISDFHLQLLGHNRAWLLRKITERGCGLSDILLFTLDDDGNFNLYKKESPKS